MKSRYSSRYPYRPQSKPKKHKFLIAILIIIAGIILAVWFGTRKASAPDQLAGSSAETGSENVKPSQKQYDLQPTIDAWLDKQPASYSIVVYDPVYKKVIGSNLPDRKLFAASLYKIYVAYLALQDIQNGDMDPNEILTGGFTRKTCIDKMIRESHSPCGEAMMADIGQKTLETRVKAMGINNTTFAGIQTTAQDSALILQYILDNRDLNTENTSFLLDAMRTQEAKFKRGLQTGASDAVWETKVGWNETSNYHDIGIMTLPDGRKYIVAILSQGQGASAPIADFARTIYSALVQ